METTAAKELVEQSPPGEAPQLTKEDTQDVEVESDSDDAAVIDIPVLTRVGLVTFSALYIVFYSGAIFGFGPMQLMLEGDGSYESKCLPEEDTPCDEQSITLVRLMFVATIMAAASPFLGYLADRVGAFALMKALSAFAVCGIALTMIASTTRLDWIYYLAFSFLGLTFYAGSVMTVQTGLIMGGGAAQRRVISLLNTLIDAGSLAYFILYLIQEATGASYLVIMGVYLGGAIVCFGGALLFWYKVVRATEAILEQPDAPAMKEKVDQTERIDTTSMSGTQTGEDADIDIDPEKPESDRRKDFAETKVPWIQSNAHSDHDENSKDYVLIRNREPGAQLKSRQYVLLSTFFVIHTARINYTMGTSRGFLGSLGDDEYDNRYLLMFTAFASISIIGLPFLDPILARYGYHVGFQAVNALGLLHGIIQVSSDNLNVQTIGFVVFSFYRGFHFAVSFSYLPLFLGGTVVGRGAGLFNFFSAFFSLGNLGLAYLTVERFNGDYFPTNLFLTLVIIPCIGVAWWMGRGMRQEEEYEEIYGSNDDAHSLVVPIRLSSVAVLEVGSSKQVVGGGGSSSRSIRNMMALSTPDLVLSNRRLSGAGKANKNISERRVRVSWHGHDS